MSHPASKSMDNQRTKEDGGSKWTICPAAGGQIQTEGTFRVGDADIKLVLRLHG
jgi:hypothetical protein